MAVVKDDEFVVARGDGALVWDEQGAEYVDAKGGLWYCAVGHGRTEIADAAREQMATLAGYDIFGNTANRPALELAERVSAIAPMTNGAVFFGSGGSDAVDTAGKLARRYWHALGRSQKTVIVHRDRSYHGMNAYGTSLAGIPANAEGFGSLVPDIAGVPTDDTDAVAELFERDGDRIAAFIGEPVIGAGGVFHPVPGYWQRVRELCSRHDVLLIADEVICGFGRLGEWFGCQRVGIEPDLVTCAKGITSGYLPLGAVIASELVQEPFWTTPGTMFRHGYTYSGHPSVCAAGLANLDIIEREQLVGRVRELEPVLASALEPLAALPAVSAVRAGLGLLGAVEIDATARAADPGLVDRLVKECREQGVLTRGLAGHSLQVSPSFVITEAQIRRIAEVFGNVLERSAPGAAAGRPRGAVSSVDGQDRAVSGAQAR
jgi:adenosylmethionine-8-amino-7-oxononanoate aminotransferase